MIQDAEQAIEKGSKSFYLASLFFSQETKHDCWVLYRWCRHCDDVIDNGGNLRELEELQTNTLKGLRGENTHAIFSSLGKVCRKHSIPAEHPFELLAGFQKDTQAVRIKNEAELDVYAYQVAGVVGVMMCYLMKANLALAQQAAISMGNAMQLTNIARDVKEDFEKGRIYLPQSWLDEAGVNTERLLAIEQREQVYTVVQRLLKKADGLYREGREGLKYLPLRSALAVAIAAAVYSQIGSKILRLGPTSLDSRIYVSFPHKIWLVGLGIFWVMSSLTGRIVLWRSNAKV